MDNDTDFEGKVSLYIDQEKIYRTEGRVGVENLCKLVGALGTTDPQNFGQFRDGSMGQLINFLEDNSGCVEAIVVWIKENGGNDDWEEELTSRLIQDTEEFAPDDE